MDIKGKIKRLEDSLSITKPLPQANCCQVITVPYGLDKTQKEELIRAEQTRILADLHNKYGTFDEQGLQWVEVLNFSTQKPLNQSKVTNEHP